MFKRRSITHSAAQYFPWLIITAATLAACDGSQSASTSAAMGAAEQSCAVSDAPTTSVRAGSVYRYLPAASVGAGSRALSFAIKNKPAWATFGEENGELTGTPNGEDVGTSAEIEISVSNGGDCATVGPFHITVSPSEAEQGSPQALPTISGSAPAAVIAGQPYVFAPSVTDRSGKPLSFSIVNRPSWTTFDPATGTLAGRPSTANVGSFAGILISVSSGGTPASLPAFSIKVQAATDGLTLSGSPASSVSAGGTYSFTPVLSNPAGDALTFSIRNAPAWAKFHTDTGELAGTPASADVGRYPNIVISASDGSADYLLPAFSIQVTPPVAGTKEALLSYLKSLAGHGVLSGQHADYLVPGMMDQVAQIFSETGKKPAILGTFMSLEHASSLVDVVALSNEWLAQGGIVITMLAPGNPTWAAAGNAPILAADGAGGPTRGAGEPNGHPVNFNSLLIPGTPEYVVWRAFLAQLVAKFKAVDGPVIVRAFPELNRRAQWWGRQPPAQFIQMWQEMVTYVRQAGVTNVLWCLNFSGGGSPPPGYADLGDVVRAYYVGDDYVDIVSLDRFPPQAGDAPAIAALTATGKPVIYAEIGAAPGPLMIPYSGDTSDALQSVTSLYPQVVATIVWGAAEALPAQNGMAAFINNSRIINLENLPPNL
jgi:hypothetical protein